MIKRKYSKRHKRWFYGFDITIGTKRIRDFVYDDRDAAQNALLDLTIGPRRHGDNPAGAGSEPVSKPCLGDLISLKLEKITRRNELTRSTRVLRDFASLLAKGESTPVEDIGYRNLKAYVRMRTDKGLIPSSINRELNIISACLRLAPIEFEELDKWVPPRIPRFPRAKQRRERTLPDSDRDRLLAHLRRPAVTGEKNSARSYQARSRIADIVEFAFLTGLRHSEILQLKKDRVDFEHKSITVFGNKTDHTRYLPLTDRLKEIISSQKNESVYIFNHGGQITPKFYAILRKACAEVNIPYGRNNGFVLHSARHTFVTRLLQAGVDLATVQALSGHSDRTMALYYGHSTEASRREAMEKLTANSKHKGES